MVAFVFEGAVTFRVNDAPLGVFIGIGELRLIVKFKVAPEAVGKVTPVIVDMFCEPGLIDCAVTPGGNLILT